MGILTTAERVSEKISDNFVFQRSILAYYEAAKLVSGTVLEIGTGSGYGVEIISKNATKFITVDKFENDNVQGLLAKFSNVEFRQINVPPLSGIEDNSVDFVITFQVLEHIDPDHKFVEEIQRVLKPGGKLILTTPNKPMSLSRNPWHVREYSVSELETLILKYFKSVDKKGVFGNQKITAYYEKNKASVARLTRFDIFNLQYRLPRWVLEIPFDIFNRINRKILMEENTNLLTDIKMEDYHIASANDQCYDLFYIAEK